MTSFKLYRQARIVYFKHLTVRASVDAESVRDIITRSLKESILNASQNPNMGILPIGKMTLQDGIALSVEITRNDYAFNSREITVGTIRVSPPDRIDVIGRYMPLKEQIAAYLTKFYQVYPTTTADGETIDYDNFIATVIF